MIGAFNNCESAHEMDGSLSSNGFLSTTTPEGAKALAILTNSCAICHGPSGQGGVSNITDAAWLVQAGLVVPGNPDASRLIIVVENNSMPPAGPLAAADKLALRAWVAGGATPLPPGPPIVVVPLGATFKSINANILTPKCMGCHYRGTGGQSPYFDSYTSTRSSVHVGFPLDSPLYTECKNGSMPQGAPDLTNAELVALFDWITTGALNN